MGIVGLLQTMVTPKSNGLEGAEKTDYIIYIYHIFRQTQWTLANSRGSTVWVAG